VTFARFKHLAIQAAKRCGDGAAFIAPVLVESLTRNDSLMRGASPGAWVSGFQLAASEFWVGDDMVMQADKIAAALVSDRSFMDDDLPLVDRAVLQSVAKAKRRIAS
jgi:hypothetical protein